MKFMLKAVGILLLSISSQVTFSLPEFPDENHATDWGYEGSDGPAHWGSVDEEDKLCKVGTQQSPINIPQLLPVKGASLVFRYEPVGLDMLRDAHNVYVHFNRAKPAPYMLFSGVRYNLIGLNFHTPSEHTIANKKYPIEVHLVHQNARGKLLIVAVMVKEGMGNTYLRHWLFEGQLPHLNQIVYQPDRKLNPAWLLPKDHSYYSYLGSITVPSCQQDVIWVVMKEPITASYKQIETLRHRVVWNNSRPVQPLNGRNVLLTQDK